MLIASTSSPLPTCVAAIGREICWGGEGRRGEGRRGEGRRGEGYVGPPANALPAPYHSASNTPLSLYIGWAVYYQYDLHVHVPTPPHSLPLLHTPSPSPSPLPPPPSHSFPLRHTPSPSFTLPPPLHSLPSTLPPLSSRYHDQWRFVFQRLSFLASLVHYMRTGQLASREGVATALRGTMCAHLRVNGAC